MLDLYTHPGLSGVTEEVAKVLASPAASHSCLHACTHSRSQLHADERECLVASFTCVLVSEFAQPSQLRSVLTLLTPNWGCAVCARRLACTGTPSPYTPS